MTPTRSAIILGLGFWVLFLVFLGPSQSTANHSYVLSVHELMAGLNKASSPANKGFYLVDVRRPDEHVRGIIPGTDLNIDYQEMKHRHPEIGAGFEDHIVVYCQSGHRSNIAAELLTDLGYKHVYNVAGSMNAWLEAGFSVEDPRQ